MQFWALLIILFLGSVLKLKWDKILRENNLLAEAILQSIFCVMGSFETAVLIRNGILRFEFLRVKSWNVCCCFCSLQWVLNGIPARSGSFHIVFVGRQLKVNNWEPNVTSGIFGSM